MSWRIQNMNRRKMNRKDRLTFAAGNLCLSLGLLLRLFVHPAGQLQKDWLDGIVGLMMGVAIAINLASLYKAGKPV